MEFFENNFEDLMQSIANNDNIVAYEALEVINKSVRKPELLGLICQSSGKTTPLIISLNVVLRKVSGYFLTRRLSATDIQECQVIIGKSVNVLLTILVSITSRISATNVLLTERIPVVLARYR